MDFSDSQLDHPDCYYNRSCRPMNISQQVPMEWAIPLYGYWMPIIVSLTVATNSFIVIVLSHKYLQTPTNYVLLAMAVSELFTGISCIPWFLYYFTLRGHEVERVYGLPSLWCSILPYVAAVLPSIFHSTAIWLTVYLAVQRYVYICVPSLVQKFCTIKRSKQVTLTICAASFAIYSTEFFATYQFSKVVFDSTTNSTRRNCYRQQTYLLMSLGNLYYELLYMMQCLIVHLLPCILLVIFTWKLVRAIQMADQRHANLLSRSVRRRVVQTNGACAPPIARLLRPRESVSEPRRVQGLKQNTRMLVVVILIFLVTEIPAGIIFIIHVLSVSMRIYIINYKLLNILLIVRNVAIVSSYPFRFAIYCGMSQQFRDVVRQMFTGRMIFRLIRDNDNSTTMAIVAMTEKESEEKRSSILLVDCGGKQRTSITSSSIAVPQSKEKGTQCNLLDKSDGVPFDPYLSDLCILVDTSDNEMQVGESEHSSVRTVGTQCETRLDMVFMGRSDSLISTALKAQTLKTCEVILSSSP